MIQRLLRYFVFLTVVFSTYAYGEIHGSLRDFRGIIHVHSNLSHDSRGKFEDMIAAAEHRRIDFLITTDHWSEELRERSPEGLFGKDLQTLVIPGAEFSKKDGVTIAAFPLPVGFHPANDWRDTVENLSRRGATTAAVHIEFTLDEALRTFDAVEITNLHAHIIEQSVPRLFWMYARVLLPCNWNLGFLMGSVDNRERWYRLEHTGEILPVFAGNDTHDNYRLFNLFGPKLASYDRTFRLITTHVWAENLQTQSVIDALHRGRSYFAFEVHGATDGFRAYMTDGVGEFLPGTRVDLGEGKLTLVVRIPDSAKKARIRVIKDGGVYMERTAADLSIPITKTGLYHIELYRRGKPWIVTNAISVR